MKILLIEDEKMLADSVKAMLSARGYEADAVYDGETGLQYARLGVYDLVILDVMMPGMNGYQVARQLRAERCAVPILMLTAKSDILDRVEGLNAGADYYLPKPFDSRIQGDGQFGANACKQDEDAELTDPGPEGHH